MRNMRSNKAQRTAKLRSLKLLFSIIICTLILILYVTEHVYIFTLEKKIHEIRNQHSDLNVQINNLKIEAAVLNKGRRITKIAQEYLGMRMPEGAPEKLF